MKALTTSYHLPVLVRDYISQQSKKLGLKKGVFLTYLIEDYQKTKIENEQLKAYFELATNTKLQQAQIDEAEEDLKSELAYNETLA